MRAFLLTVALILIASQAQAADPSYLYQAKFIQAAPGKLLELIEQLKAGSASYGTIGDEAPLWIRHSQGDKWDLMVLLPMGKYPDYYSAERVAKRTQMNLRLAPALKPLIAWQEDIFVFGPPLSQVRIAFNGSAFFHLEIFQALPGRQDDLYREREMENAYQRALKRPENLIFVRDQGASWDLFTVGAYRDIKHYAESADISTKDQDAAARAAGFEAANRIGPYLRTLISQHHDTLAVAVK